MSKTYRIELTGYGGEIVLGTIDADKHQYFLENDIDYDEYANDWDNEMDVPEDMQPFEPGSWHDCDDIAHETGVEMSDLCQITVYDQDGNVVWEHNLDPAELQDSGVVAECGEEVYVNDQDTGTPVFLGQSVEKGTFFGGEIQLTSEFDCTKITLYYSDIEGWPLCTGVQYDGEDVDGYDSYDTTGKSMEMKVIISGE